MGFGLETRRGLEEKRGRRVKGGRDAGAVLEWVEGKKWAVLRFFQ